MTRKASFDRVSVVIPVTGRHDDPETLFGQYSQALRTLGADLEFVYVLDGPYPEVRAALDNLQAAGEPIRVISLGRSFGEAAALSVGFRHCAGDAVVILPAFLQVEPADLPRLVRQLESVDMVVGRRWPRSDSRFNRLQTSLFFGLVSALTRSRFKDIGCGVRAMRRQVCEEVVLYGDQHRFLPMLAAHRGFRVAEVNLAQSPRDGFRRVHAPGIYVRRLLDLLTVFFLVKFTRKPMRFFGLVGTCTAGAGVLYLLYLLFERLVLGVPLADRPALLLSSLLVVLGVQVFAMGLIGELIIYTHARQMQEYAIAETIGDMPSDTDTEAPGTDSPDTPLPASQSSG